MGLYHLCSRNKGADQFRGYHYPEAGNREADLPLCFGICKKNVGFLMARLKILFIVKNGQ